MKSRIVRCKDCGEEFDTEAGGLYRYRHPQLWICPKCAGRCEETPQQEIEQAAKDVADLFG